MLSWESRRVGWRDAGSTRRREPTGARLALSLLPYAALLAALAGLVACGNSASAPSPSSPPPAETSVVVGPLEPATVRMGTTVAAGGTVEIVAPENPSTGYAWTLRLPAGATLVSDAYAGPSPSPSPLVGAGGSRTWVVRIDQVGSYAIRGAYARPWESRRPLARFVLTAFACPPDQPVPTMVFTARESPGLWAVDTGTVAAICLEENAATGYAWTMTLGPGLELLSEQAATPNSSPSPVAGAGGQHVWMIRVAKAGRTSITGEYARPTQPDGPTAKTFSLTIDAGEPGAD